jgi:hypothetical protein
VPADVRNATAMRAFARAAGDFQIALLNAGVGGYGVRRLVDVDDSYLSPSFEHDPLEINLRGLIISMREVLRHWEARCKEGGGDKCARAMVVTGSTSGEVGVSGVWGGCGLGPRFGTGMHAAHARAALF